MRYYLIIIIIMLIFWSRNISDCYQCWKLMLKADVLLHIFVETIFFQWIESSKEQRLFKLEIYLKSLITLTDLSFSSHVKAVTKSAYYHLKNIARIRCFVSSQDLEKLVHAFISSRVDYCNDLVRQLQLIQNTAAGSWPEPEHLSISHQSSGPYTGFSYI